MKKLNIKENAASILASNPKLDIVYMTSDGLGYSTAEAAESRQNAIDASQKVVVVKRNEKTTEAENIEVTGAKEIKEPVQPATEQKGATDAKDIKEPVQSATEEKVVKKPVAKKKPAKKPL